MRENLDWCDIFLALSGKTCYYMAYKFQYTYIPFLITDFDISEDEWMFSQTLNEIAMLITSPMAMMFDKMAPNKVMGWGLAIPFLSMFLLPLGIQQFGIPSYPWIIANRIVFGLGTGLWMTAIAGIIGDFTPDNKRGRAFGIVEFSYSLSDFFIPLIGLSLQYWPVNVIYYVQGMIAFVVAAGLLWRFPRRAKRALSLDHQNTTMWSLLWKPSTIGAFMFALLSAGYMITFSYYGIWLESDHGFTSDKVGAAYFVTYTISGCLVLIWSVFFSDRVGLIRSAYLSVVLFTFPVGLIFTFLNKSIQTSYCLWLLCLFTVGTEGMFVTSMGYITTAEFCPNPLFMSALWRTAFALGKVFSISVSPSLWSFYGKMLGPTAVTNQFGLMVATSTLLIILGMVCFKIGKSCEKRVL